MLRQKLRQPRLCLNMVSLVLSLGGSAAPHAADAKPFTQAEQQINWGIPSVERSDNGERKSTSVGDKTASSIVQSTQKSIARLERSRQQTAEKGAPESEIKRAFNRVVMLANNMNPQLNRARAESQAAVDEVDEAKGQRWPQVDVTVDSKKQTFGGGVRSHQNDVPTLSLNVVTNVYDFGQNESVIRSRENTARAAASGVTAEAENTASEVSSLLVELSKQRLIIDASKQYVTRMSELVTMLSGIVAVDAGRRSELTQAKGQLLQAQTGLEAATARTREIEISLYKYIGDNRISLPENPEWQLRVPDATGQLRAIDNHPVVKKAQAEAEAALSEAKAVRASGLPKLNWVISKNTREDDFGRTQPFETGLQVSWGLFRGGSSQAAERAAVMKAEASRQIIDEQRLDLEHRVREADQQAQSLLERSALYHDLALETDQIRLDFFEQWYYLGKRTLLDVLSAESDYYNNRVNEISNRFDGYNAIFQGVAYSGQLIPWLQDKIP